MARCNFDLPGIQPKMSRAMLINKSALHPLLMKTGTNGRKIALSFDDICQWLEWMMQYLFYEWLTRSRARRCLPMNEPLLGRVSYDCSSWKLEQCSPICLGFGVCLCMSKQADYCADCAKDLGENVHERERNTNPLTRSI